MPGHVPGSACKHEGAYTIEAPDRQMIGRMRLVLAISALLTIFIDPVSVEQAYSFTWLIFSCYALHSALLCIVSALDMPVAQSKRIHWLDLCWYALIVFFTGGSSSNFFLFFLFAILTSSFRWGFEEGARITLASVAMYILSSLLPDTQDELSRLLLRATFLLTLGYMIAYWGELHLALKRRMALLRDVSQLSNPRFGVDHTIAGTLEKARVFFKAASCILVLRNDERTTHSLRTASGGAQPVRAEQISAEAAAPLLAPGPNDILLYPHPSWPARLLAGAGQRFDSAAGKWEWQTPEAGMALAELLEARSFISAPLPVRLGAGRVYVVSRDHRFGKGDALFLGHLVAQAFPVIENIDLLDRMASDAAWQERRKIARDLHDVAIQPYIGLQLGLNALRNKAAGDNPLLPDLDKLTAMTIEVVDDLRRYTGAVKGSATQGTPALLTTLRRQAARAREFYGIDIAIDAPGELNVSDRLAAEVYQLVSEGISNIRRHTDARRASVGLRCAGGQLAIDIENEGAGTTLPAFTPKSISERAAALGGIAQVKAGHHGSTVIHVEIPV